MGKDNLRAGPPAVLDVPALEQELITIRDLESGCRSWLTGLVDEPIAPWSWEGHSGIFIGIPVSGMTQRNQLEEKEVQVVNNHLHKMKDTRRGRVLENLTIKGELNPCRILSAPP